MKVLRPPLRIALALLVALPTAAASAAGGPAPGDFAELEIDPLPGGTLPPGRTVTTEVKVKFCAAASGVGGPRHVALEYLEGPEWLAATFEPDRVTFPAVLPGQCDSAQGILRLNASTDAPAYEDVQAEFRVRDVATGDTYGTQLFLFRTGFWGALEVTPQRGALTAKEGEPTPYAFNLRNTGNAKTKFHVEVPGSVRGLQVAPPGDITLDPGQSTRPEVLFIASPDGPRETREVTLLVTSHAYYDHEAWGDSAVLTVRVTPEAGEPTERFAPGPGALLLLAGLAGTAGAWRARR